MEPSEKSKVNVILTQKGYTWEIQVNFDETDTSSVKRALKVQSFINDKLLKKYDNSIAYDFTVQQASIKEQVMKIKLRKTKPIDPSGIETKHVDQI